MGNSTFHFSEEEQEDVRTAISMAELDTSGEIRVHIEDNCPGDCTVRAREVFEKLGMQSTEQRNGVLFYLAVNSRKFAIISDEGIMANLEPGFWDTIKHKMLNHFREERFVDGLFEGIILTGEQLKKYFPRTRNDKNQLPDEVTFGAV
jgi:uncharacterized membrane protein